MYGEPGVQPGEARHHRQHQQHGEVGRDEQQDAFHDESRVLEMGWGGARTPALHGTLPLPPDARQRGAGSGVFKGGAGSADRNAQRPPDQEAHRARAAADQHHAQGAAHRIRGR